MPESSDQQPPSQLTGQLKSAQGQLYQAIGSVSSDPSWKEQGEQLVKAGQGEAEAARLHAKGEAVTERFEGKVESAYGMLTGDQEHMKDGNLKAEKGEWKRDLADGTLPVPSVERAKAKVESAVGMVTGDYDKQKEGNIRAEKAEWLNG
ncbi:hypothetical protein JCM5296_003764 [Sporobolomyces johnsonii]